MPAIQIIAEQLTAAGRAPLTGVGTLTFRPIPRPINDDDGTLSPRELVVTLVDGEATVTLDVLPTGYAYSVTVNLGGGSYSECVTVDSGDEYYHLLTRVDRASLTTPVAPPAWVTGLDAEEAARIAGDAALDTRVDTLEAAGVGSVDWVDVQDKPATFPPTIGSTGSTAVAGNDARLTDARTPTAHTHPATEVSDSTATGRSVLTAVDAAAARTAIGAGTSSLALGTSGSTAKAGDYQPTAANISDSTTAGRALLTAADAAAQRTALTLGNVDNTADTAKPVSTAQAAADTAVAAAAASALATHTGNTSNPHSVTKTQVGLGNVDNTADTAKPVSTAQATADTAATAAAVAVSAQRASNLSDLASASTARTNLGLGTAATVDTGTGAGNAILGNDARLTDTRTPTDNTVTNAKVAAGAAIDLDKTADSATRLAMTTAERTKLAGLENPYYASVPFSVPPIAISSATTTPIYAAGQVFNGTVQSPASTSGNWYEWSIVVAAGTYSLATWWQRGTNCGIARVLVDTVEKGTIDAYGTFLANNRTVITGIALAGGRHVVRFQMDNKNASSSAYFFVLNEFDLTRTGA